MSHAHQSNVLSCHQMNGRLLKDACFLTICVKPLYSLCLLRHYSTFTFRSKSLYCEFCNAHIVCVKFNLNWAFHHTRLLIFSCPVNRQLNRLPCHSQWRCHSKPLCAAIRNSSTLLFTYQPMYLH